MDSGSAQVSAERPFYDLHARAYDALITDPVAPWVEAVDDHLRDIGRRQTSILDAGCGTGRHAAALIGLGHRVSLLDASPALLAIASERCPDAPTHVADICAPGFEERFDAIVCRGVLNDLIADHERAAVLDSFANLLAPGGVVILDVREKNASAARADGTWRKTEADLCGGRIVFESRPTWTERGRIGVEERYTLLDADGSVRSTRDYSFQMRPWSGDELVNGLAAVGFSAIEVRPGVGRRTEDRLFVTARR